MSEKYKVRNLEGVYFITCTVIDWVDLLTRPDYKQVIIDSLKHCQKKKGLQVHAFVIMSNHFHAILSSTETPLNDIVRDIKKFTSKEFIKTISEINESRRVWLLKKFSFAANRIKRAENYKIWKDGFHQIELTDMAMVWQKLDYIHMNPVKDMIVLEPKHYYFSSAAFYEDEDNGLLTINPIV